MRVSTSIVKLEIRLPELKKSVEAFAENRLRAWDALVSEVRLGVTGAVDQLLHAEMSLFLGHPDQADNKRNGYEERDYVLKGIGALRVRMPIDRKRRFQSNIIPRHERVDPRIKEDLAALHLAGISTRTLALISERVLGVEFSRDSVTRSLESLKSQAEGWLRRPIESKYWALIIDGTNFRVRRRGSVAKEPLLVVLGIDENNHKSILAIEPGVRDNVDAWRACFRDLKARGLDPSSVRVGVMDGLPGLERLFVDEFSQAVTARCWFHVLQSSLGNDATRAVACLERDLDSLVTRYRFEKAMWRSLKTTNAVERIHKEFKRRARSMEALVESTLMTVVAFTALKIELGWRMRRVDSYRVDHLQGIMMPVRKSEEVEEDLH
jgi:putative transposase